MKLNRAHALFLFFSLAGIVFSLLSAEHWYQLQLGQADGPSYCNLSEYWNCDRVSFSAWSDIASVPLGIFSAIYFFILILLSFTRGISSRVLFVLHLPAVLWSGFLVYQLMFVLEAGCLLCYGMDLCWLGAAVSSWFIRPPSSLRKGAAIFIGVIGLALFSLYPLGRMKEVNKMPSESELQRFRVWFQSLPAEPIPSISPMTRQSTAASGNIEIVEFSDFACPFCEKASRTLVPFLLAQRDVKFSFFPLPLDTNCHPDMRRQVHPHSCDWSKVAICSAHQGNFWRVHDEIYQINRESGTPVTDKHLGEMGLEVEPTKACMSSKETEEVLKNMIQVARDLKVNATPTFFINGKRIQGIIDPRLFKILLDEVRQGT